MQELQMWYSVTPNWKVTMNVRSVVLKCKKFQQKKSQVVYVMVFFGMSCILIILIKIKITGL